MRKDPGKMGVAGGGWVASLGGREELRERQQEGKMNSASQ